MVYAGTCRHFLKIVPANGRLLPRRTFDSAVPQCAACVRAQEASRIGNDLEACACLLESLALKEPEPRKESGVGKAHVSQAGSSVDSLTQNLNNLAIQEDAADSLLYSLRNLSVEEDNEPTTNLQNFRERLRRAVDQYVALHGEEKAISTLRAIVKADEVLDSLRRSD